MAEENDDTGELISVPPFRWYPLGDTGVEVMIGRARGAGYPVRYRVVEDKSVKKSGGIKK